MSDDRVKNFVEAELQRALEPHVGRPLTADLKRHIEREIAAATALLDAVQNSTLAFHGPYQTWREHDGVVHRLGFLGNRRVRVCDFKEVLLGVTHPDEPVSCLRCMTEQLP